jgi:predicted O-methyltransferase YrrM
VPPPFPERNWFFPATRDLLTRSLTPEVKLVVEVGSWTGRSTRYIADAAPGAAVIAIDHWKGSPEHEQDPELAPALPNLYDTFLAECWAYRDRIVPLRAASVAGLLRVRELNLRPDIVYIDGDHRYEAVVADLTTTLDLFPEATIVGDDWDWEGVRAAVETVGRQRSLQVDVLGTAWRIPKRR